MAGNASAASRGRGLTPPTAARPSTPRPGPSFANYFTAREDGKPLDAEAATYAEGMLDQLDWWAGAPADARARRPYPA